MTYIKIMVTVNTLLLVFIVLVIGYAWLQVQGIGAGFSPGAGGAEASAENVQAGASGTNAGEPITINVSQLPESQQQILRSLGFTASSYTITAEMRTCAEGRVGVARLSEIAAGSAPTAMEAAALMPCVR